MLASVAAIVLGLMVLVWSADRFVDGASATARYAGMPPLLIGMVIVGFGTSAPEIVVSAIAAWQGNSGLALGNAYGSNIANIGLILGVTALISPIAVHKQVLRKELPILLLITLLSLALLWNGLLSRLDAIILLSVFTLLLGWSIRQGLRHSARGEAVREDMPDDNQMSRQQALFWLVAGLVLLVISSRFLVWGAVNVAQAFGVSDLVIGLTIVAIGTSLPELASSIVAIRKNQHDLAIGNVIGSNLFNTLMVVGLAGIIHPMSVAGEVINRDFVVLIGLTVLLLVFGYGFRGKQGQLSRFKGAILLVIYVSYTGWLARSVIMGA